jgi:hypothetical protein
LLSFRVGFERERGQGNGSFTVGVTESRSLLRRGRKHGSSVGLCIQMDGGVDFWFNNTMQNITKRLGIWAGVVVLVLLIPLIAMQFSGEVKWDLFDFIIIGAVLFSAGLAFEFIARRSNATVYRIAFGIGLAGNEGQPANLLYGAVFVVGLIGSLAVRLESKGMARTLFATAVTQILVTVIALFVWPPPETSWSPSVVGVFVLSGFFAVLFVISAMLFQRAGSNQAKPVK